jgi:hypothetical protein
VCIFLYTEGRKMTKETVDPEVLDELWQKVKAALLLPVAFAFNSVSGRAMDRRRELVEESMKLGYITGVKHGYEMATGMRWQGLLSESMRNDFHRA